MCSYVFFLRFPNNFTDPNFYAEDGNVFLRNILDRGFVDALFTTFNGYYVFGIYLLEGIGILINNLLYDGEFVNLPRAFAICSYAFLGLLATLPVLLFRKYFKKIALLFIVLLSVFIPMQQSDYAVIGAIGNLKFAFLYLAFLLLIYRHIMPKGSKKVYLIDIALMICAYTNATVYPMLLFASLRYIPYLRQGNFLKSALKDRTLQSLAVLALAVLPQLYIVYRDGIPPLHGYMDAPFNFARSIEIFISRSYLYTVTSPLTNLMNDWIVIILAILALSLVFVLSLKIRIFYIFGLVTVFLATFLFTIKRTGISDSYLGYANGGPDQFFYAQNMIFAFILSIALVEIIDRLSSARYKFGIYAALALLCIVILAPNSSAYGKNNFMAEQVGTIYANSKVACQSKRDSFDISSYPAPNFIFYEQVTRQELCTEDVYNYYPRQITLNLTPAGNNYVAGLGEKNNFTQTFLSPQDNLDGLSVYFSTFQQKIDSPYTLTLMDGGCRSSLRSVNLPTKKFDDNTYHLLTFRPISNSRDKSYCFTIKSKAGERNIDPLAVQLSADNIYLAGQATLNNKPSNKDVVFNLHYK